MKKRGSYWLWKTFVFFLFGTVGWTLSLGFHSRGLLVWDRKYPQTVGLIPTYPEHVLVVRLSLQLHREAWYFVIDRTNALFLTESVVAPLVSALGYTLSHHFDFKVVLYGSLALNMPMLRVSSEQQFVHLPVLYFNSGCLCVHHCLSKSSAGCSCVTRYQ